MQPFRRLPHLRIRSSALANFSHTARAMSRRDHEGQGMGMEHSSGLSDSIRGTGMTSEFRPGMRVEYRPSHESPMVGMDDPADVQTGVVVGVRPGDGPEREGLYEIFNEKTGRKSMVSAVRILKPIGGEEGGGSARNAGPERFDSTSKWGGWM